MDQKDYAERLKTIVTKEHYSWVFVSSIIGISPGTIKRFVDGEYVGPRSVALIKDYVDHWENAQC